MPPPKRVPQTDAISERLSVVNPQADEAPETLRLSLDAKATVDVGLDWKRRAPAPRAALVSIANGWMRYLPHPRNFEEPEAHLKYEILQSTLVPQAAEQLLARAEALARGLA